MLQIPQPTISYFTFSPISFPKTFCPVRNVTVSLGHIKFPCFIPLKPVIPRCYCSDTSGTLRPFQVSRSTEHRQLPLPFALLNCKTTAQTVPFQQGFIQPANCVPSHPLFLSCHLSQSSISELFVLFLIACIPHETVSSLKAKTLCLLLTS